MLPDVHRVFWQRTFVLVINFGEITLPGIDITSPGIWHGEGVKSAGKAVVEGGDIPINPLFLASHKCARAVA